MTVQDPTNLVRRFKLAALAGVSMAAMSGAGSAREGGRLPPPVAERISIVPISAGAASPILDAGAARSRISIPPGPLEPALTALARQMQLKLAYNTTLTENLVTPGAEGAYLPLEALARVLEGTGLVYRAAGASTITLVNPRYVQLGASTAAPSGVLLDELSVEGRREAAAGLPPRTGTVGQPPVPYAGGQVGSGARLGVLGNRDVFSTPFNVAGYTEKLIRDQQAQSLIDVVENDPSVRPLGTLSDAYGSGFFIRGFPVLSADVGFDGLFGIVDYRRPFVFNAERVEVLKGPSTVINGASPNGNVGGSINIIPKRAYDEPLTRITPFFISHGQFGTAVDVGRRFGEQKEWGIRANGVFQKGETAIDKERLQLGFGSLAVDYRGSRFRMSADLAYQDLDYSRNRGFLLVFPGVDIPRAPKLSTNLEQRGQFTRDHSLLGATRLEYDLTDNTTVYAAFGANAYHGDAYTDFKYLVAPDGTFSNTFVRQRFDTLSYTAETGVRSTFDTGPVRHTVSLAATGYWTTQTFPVAVQFLPSPGLSNLYNPAVVPAPGFTDINIGDARYSSQVNRSIAFADTISSLDDRVQLTVGGRVQQFNGKYLDYTPGSPNFGLPTSSYDKSHVSPAVAFLVKPTERLSLYGNYVEALIAPPTSPVPFSAALSPIVGDQKEVGLKYDFGPVGTSLSFFEISRPNGVLNPVTLAFSNDGLQRNRGIELNVFGEPAPGFRLLGGVTFLDGRLVRTVATAANPNAYDGNVAPGVPDVQLNLYGEYDLPPWLLPGLTATGRVIYTAKQFYDQANTQSIPDWTRVDAGLRYTFLGSWGKPVTLRANVVNLLNARYWNSTAYSGLLSLGTPRTYQLSAQLDF
ncbi:MULTISPECIES: TonB-dependent receptor [Methylobacterium]|uniref:Vitamin B12 transporter BtuB n=2 Tax=Pseudomonadota TaxID=1224 RepID=A0ABQ4SSI3_9HYPH|nr:MULTISPECIES: TonB-dependent receptor [Methylobacterium]PIU04277.1 MAG: TonB-dependent siderophore receptor [Methylobacterium sp. CG09_land_8_20_14_0_10_71_15]PIU13054.1 MAG: TonB-dependent siderophore receptor [Methylobacterium sp. CG08_land_8_20_14_0_20_71_15]GBU15794.1 TonB-dependent siderophore receptor [Methylobacterium sp.]GJE05251.1 Vitamin B12 transporter BtuB [Methylobacterium jeotgali]